MTDEAPGRGLAALLGHDIRDEALFRRALTHASALPSGAPAPEKTYQRLEFLGDRVLSLVVADALIKAFPEDEEGDLAVRLNALVRAETLAAIAEEIGLGRFAHWGEGEARKASRARAAILADMMESVIAALYRDGGFEAARAFILRHWNTRLAEVASVQRDPKTRLQEWYQGRGLAAPVYTIVSRSGPDHAPVFDIEVRDGTGRAERASGPSKRAGQQAAAALLLKRLETEAS
ncbi:MAG: ribonuclease III [Hyphomicrobiaceae bacterium]|nr:ribonuclease III [Hyphomicrobiaceae bacterium]